MSWKTPRTRKLPATTAFMRWLIRFPCCRGQLLLGSVGACRLGADSVAKSLVGVREMWCTGLSGDGSGDLCFGHDPSEQLNQGDPLFRREWCKQLAFGPMNQEVELLQR